MEEWAKVQRHVADEITLLCDQHHREKTGGLLPREVVFAANKNPHNKKSGVSKPYDLHFFGPSASVSIGSNTFRTEHQGYGTALIPLSIDGVAIIGFILGDDHLLLNLVLFDEFNVPVLHIKNNQLYYSQRPWDIQLTGTTLVVREAARKLLLELTFKPPSEVTVTKGRFLLNGVEVLVRPQNVLLSNNAMYFSGTHADGAIGGFFFGHHQDIPSCIYHMHSIPRYLGDRSAALEFERECQRTVGA